MGVQMKDISQLEREFEEYEKRIRRLKELGVELNSLNTEGLEAETNAIKSKLKDPKKVEEIEKDIATLKVKIKERKEWKKTTPGLFDTAQRLANEATKLFEGKRYKKSLEKYQDSLRKFKDARNGAEGLKDEGLVKAIEKDIYNVKRSIIACESAIGISFSEEAKELFDAGKYENAISDYKNAIAKFEDAVENAKEIEEYESVERIEGLTKGAEENIENCQVAIDKREVENLFKQSKSLHEEAVELARSGEMFNAKSILRDAEGKINTAFKISTERKFSDAVNKLNLLLETIREEMNVIDKNIAEGTGSVDFSEDIFKIKMEGEPGIEIPTEKKGTALIIERAIYDPCKGDFIERPLPRMRDWIYRHDPSAYWFAIAIQNNTDKAITEWDVDLTMSAALKVIDARIEGIEREVHQETHLKSFKIAVPKQYGIVISKESPQRVYFKLRAEKPQTPYRISGVFKSNFSDDVPIRAKEFKYRCDAGSLRKLEHPEDDSGYTTTQLGIYYSPQEVIVITEGLNIVSDIREMCASRYPKRADVKSRVEHLKIYLKNVEHKLGRSYADFENLVREMDAVLFEKTVPEDYTEEMKRKCLDFRVDLATKLQRQSIERGG